MPRFMFSALALFVLIPLLMAADSGTVDVDTGTIVQCSSGRYFEVPDGETAATICPAALTSPSVGSVTDDAASLTFTTDVGAGTYYCLTNTSATAPARSVLLAETGVTVSSAGAIVRAITGLSNTTQYYSHCIQDARDKYSNIMTSPQFTTLAPGGANALTDTFDGTGDLDSRWVTSNGPTVPPGDDATPLSALENAQESGKYVMHLKDNTGDDTLHFNNDQGRLDAQYISFPFEVIARNIGIGTVADDQVIPAYTGDPVLFGGVQVHDADLTARTSAHAVVGHRGSNAEATVEGKNTVAGVSTVTDEGSSVCPLGRCDIRVVGTVSNDVEIYYDAPGGADNWVAYAGTGDLPGTDPTFSDNVYVGVICYAQGTTGVPFKCPVDEWEVVTGALALAPPTSLVAANAGTGTAVNLAWTDNAGGETGYEIHRGTSTGNLSLLTTLAANASSYTDTGLTTSVEYFYDVRAVDADNQSTFAGEDSATPTVLEAGWAMPFDEQVVQNRTKYLSLSAWSERIEHETNTELNPNHLRYQPYRYNTQGVFTSWRVTTLPTNGDLYDRGCNSGAGCYITSTSQSFSTGDNLIYEPDVNYVGPDSFTYVANDPTLGDTVAATVNLSVTTAANFDYKQFVATPDFGMIEEVPDDPAGWATGKVQGWFYVDKDDPNAVTCTDVSGDGWPGAPCSNVLFRAVVDAGSAMKVQAASSCYELQNAGAHDLDLNGTAGNVAWMYGNEASAIKPELCRNSSKTGDSRLELEGRYMVMAGFKLDKVRLQRKTNTLDERIAYRGMEITGGEFGGQSAVQVFGTKPTDTHWLITDLHVHRNGIQVTPAYNDENDSHAFLISQVQYVHLIGVITHDNGGDGIQAGDGNNALFIFSQDWRCHTEGEQCMDWKNMGQVGGARTDLVYVFQNPAVWDGRAASPTNGSPTSGHGLYQNDDNTHWNGRALIANGRSWDNAVAQIVVSQVDRNSSVMVIGNIALHGKNDEFDTVCYVGSGASSCGGSIGAGLGSFKNSDHWFYFNTTYNTQVGIQTNSAGLDGNPVVPIKYFGGNLVDDVDYWHVKQGSGLDSGEFLDWNGYGGTFNYGGASNTAPFPDINFSTYQGTAQASDPDRGSQSLVVAGGADFVNPNQSNVRPQESLFINAIPIAEITSDPIFAGLRQFMTEWGLADITELRDRQGDVFCADSNCNFGAIQGLGTSLFAGGVEAAVASLDIDGNTVYGPSQSPSAALQDQVQIDGFSQALWRVKTGTLDSRITLTELPGGDYSVTIQAGTPAGTYPFTVELFDVATLTIEELAAAPFRAVEVQ